VYLNVQKGDIAKKKDLLKAFGSEDMEAACMEVC